MTEGFQILLAASNEECRDLFVGAADRPGTNEQSIEKDFWVCNAQHCQGRASLYCASQLNIAR
jgi:hypothetical protein